ncbi:MAG: hypothetical protein ACI4QP_01400 [Candidatus Enteromonas sp.]
MFKRKIYDKLVKWKQEEKGHKAILIEGARRIGKSTVAEEFAWAMGEEMLIQYIQKCFDKKEPLIDALHKKAMFLLKQYVLVGGMPKAIDSFIAHQKQFEPCEQEKRDILETYRDDIHKIDRSYRSKVLSIFDQIPAFLSQHEKRVPFNRLLTTKPGLNTKKHSFG